MMLRNALIALSLLAAPAAFAGNFADEENLALAMARANYAANLQDAMHVNYQQTKMDTLRDRQGNAIGYWVSVEVDGFENGAATKRHYRVESNNEAGVISSVKLSKTEGPVGP